MAVNPYKSSASSMSYGGEHLKKPKFGIVKKILIALGVVMLLFILLFVWVGYKTSSTYNKLEGKAEPLIRTVLKQQSPWNYKTLKPYLSELWIKDVSQQNSEKLMKLFSKLGKFESISKIKWLGCSTNTTTKYGTIDRCNYEALANYSNGKAQVLVGVADESGKPKIIQIRINSDVFFK